MTDRKYPSLHKNRMQVPYGWVQWKGTDVCIDINCKCGYLSHYDGDFAYHIKCPICQRVYEVSGFVKLHELDFEPEYTKDAEL